MSSQSAMPAFSGTAFRASAIAPLPEAPTKRTRIGEELQPVGSYAEAVPYLGAIEAVEALQDSEKSDPGLQDEDWWWDHQRIRFLNGKLGFRLLILVIPITWVIFLWLSGIAVIGCGIIEANKKLSIPSEILVVGGTILSFLWFFFAIWATPVTTNWIMSTGIGFLLKPFEKTIQKKVDETLEDGCSEFNRVTGQVRIALGRGRNFEAPFVEFDTYVDRVIQESGVFYRLVFVHRYTQKTFNKTAFSRIEANKNEVLATWDMLQRYMDVSQPLPDTPRLEPFRHLDPVTAEHDRKTGRDPRYWRDLDLETWKDGEGGAELHRHQNEYPWTRRTCKLTPQLGKVSMEEYRKQRPAEAWPI